VNTVVILCYFYMLFYSTILFTHFCHSMCTYMYTTVLFLLTVAAHQFCTNAYTCNFVFSQLFEYMYMFHLFFDTNTTHLLSAFLCLIHFQRILFVSLSSNTYLLVFVFVFLTIFFVLLTFDYVLQQHLTCQTCILSHPITSSFDIKGQPHKTHSFTMDELVVLCLFAAHFNQLSISFFLLDNG
jgi:hypothetical protein